MSRRRLVVIYLLIGGLLGGHLVDAVTRREHWPFSYYGMFDSVANSPGVEYRIVCLGPGPDGHVSPFAVKPSWLPSLPGYKFQLTLMNLVDGQKPDRAKLHQLLADYLDSYNRYRTYSGMNIPLATGLRLYRVTVPLQEPIRPISDIDPAASGGVLIMEVTVSVKRAVNPPATPK